MKSIAVLILLASTTLVRAQEATPAATPAPAAPSAPAGDAAKVLIGTIPGVMKFDKTEFSVKPGQAVALMFSNKACPLQHNIAILKPGTDAAYGKAADEMMQKDAAGALKANYLPTSADVIAKSSKLIGLGQNEIINFTAPAEAGDYPFICTFPGHRFLMKGVMKVAP